MKQHFSNNLIFSLFQDFRLKRINKNHKVGTILMNIRGLWGNLNLKGKRLDFRNPGAGF